MGIYTIAEYVSMCTRTAIYPEEVAAPYLALGLCSEAAEINIASHVSEYVKELGDCQWYLCRLATHLGFDFAELVQEASTTQIVPYVNLCTEAGIIAGHIKKQLRDGAKWNGEQREEIRQKLRACIVKCLAISIAMAETGADIPYLEVLQINDNKLTSRQERGTLSGSGDNR